MSQDASPDGLDQNQDRSAARAARRLDFDRLSRADLEAAVWGPSGGEARSDYDLAPERWPRPATLRPAAVLCPIVARREGFRVILTRRAAHLSRHAGQVAFPGGRVDPEDPSPLAAALREAHEEIGLAPDQVEVLGAIDSYETVTGYSVTPFVGLVSAAFRPIADDSEVAEVFETPLGYLMNPANHQIQARGTRGRAYAMPYDGYDIWGATAGMLRNLSDRMLASRPLDDEAI